MTTALEVRCTGLVILTMSSKRRTEKKNVYERWVSLKIFINTCLVLTMTVKACYTNCVSKTVFWLRMANSRCLEKSVKVGREYSRLYLGKFFMDFFHIFFSAVFSNSTIMAHLNKKEWKKCIYLYLGSLCIQFFVETCNISLDVLGGFGEVRSGRGQRKINMGLEIRGSFG